MAGNPNPFLSLTQIADIKAILGQTTDQFFKTPVAYHKLGESVDRFNENRPKADDPFDLLALVEYPSTKGDFTFTSESGKVDEADIKVTLAVKDLKEQDGLWDGGVNKANFTPEKDFFTAKGKKYRVVYLGYDGPLDDESILVILYGNPYEKTS